MGMANIIVVPIEIIDDSIALNDRNFGRHFGHDHDISISSVLSL